MNDVSKTIGWAEKSWNIYSGCYHWKTGVCVVGKDCYAKKLAEGRLRGRFGYDTIDPFKPTFHSNRLEEPLKLKKPSKIFVSDMGDLFGDWVPREWIKDILKIIKQCPQHTFQFLTKNPSHYIVFYFPSNCWLGTTINWGERRDIILKRLKIDNIKFISFEPLLNDCSGIDLEGIDWIILGGQSGPKKLYPLEEWIERIEDRADQLGIPVFEKDNLRKDWVRIPRREFPKEAS